MLSLTLTLGAKNREKGNNLRKKVENRKKIRKELSPLLAILTVMLKNVHSCCYRKEVMPITLLFIQEGLKVLVKLLVHLFSLLI